MSMRSEAGDSDEEIVGNVRRYCQIRGKSGTGEKEKRKPVSALKTPSRPSGNQSNGNFDDSDEDGEEDLRNGVNGSRNSSTPVDRNENDSQFPGFRTPEIVRKTRDSPALKLTRPHFVMGDVQLAGHESINRPFVGENPLLGQVFSQFSSAPKKIQSARPSLPDTRRFHPAGSLRKMAHTQPRMPSASLAPPLILSPSVPSVASPALRNRSTSLLASADGGADGASSPGQDGACVRLETTRLDADFVDVHQIGVGEFGSVYKCRHRLDGCTYAVKCSRKPLNVDRECLRELQVHALLSKHPNVVRYYSSWCEDGYVYVQTEYCAGGSLRELLEQQSSTAGDPSSPGMFGANKKRRRPNLRGRSGGAGDGRLEAKRKGLVEDVLLAIGKDVARGLAYMHAVNLAHLDIKPDNIFVSHDVVASDSSIFSCFNARPNSSRSFTASPMLGGRRASSTPSPVPSIDAGAETVVVYRIGDFGRAVPLNTTSIDEGDSRYVSLEGIQEKVVDLAKVDVFALGLTLFELATGEGLPNTGEKWTQLRATGAPAIQAVSPELTSVIQAMTDPSPSKRPSADEVLQYLTDISEGAKLHSGLGLELSPSPTLGDRHNASAAASTPSSTSVAMDDEDQVMVSPERAPAKPTAMKERVVKRAIHDQ